MESSIVPIRCSCGAVIIQKWKEWRRLQVQENQTPLQAFQTMGVNRLCCKNMIIPMYGEPHPFPSKPIWLNRK